MNPLVIIGRAIDWDAIKDSPRERWAVSSAYFDNPGAAPKLDKLFQLHAPDIWEPKIEAIKDRLVIAWNRPEFESCEKLPCAELVKKFGPIFPSSISWMLAYAIFLGYSDIEIRGVHMIAESEYGPQRDYLFYLMGIARGMGVKVTSPQPSGIYLPPMIYGVPKE